MPWPWIKTAWYCRNHKLRPWETVLAAIGTLVGSALLALSLVGFAQRKQAGMMNLRLTKGPIIVVALLIAAGLISLHCQR